MENLHTKKTRNGSNFGWLIRQMSITQKRRRQTFRRRFVSGSLFVSPCPAECSLQSETKIEPDLRLGWTRISWSSVTSKKKTEGHCLNFRGRTYRLANPQIPTFTQPHAASINTGDTNNASILWKVPHTVLLVLLSWFSNRTGKREKRTKLDFRCPISRSAIGQASCLICARRRQMTFPFCC